MRRKKKLGIIGGMGARAGALLLQKLIDYSPAETDQEFLEIIFHNNSAVPDRTRAIVHNGPSPLADILRSVNLFNENGVEVMAMACVTAYYYYDHICACTRARVVNPLQLVAEEIGKEYSGAKRIGLLATTGTIQSGIFHDALHGLNMVTLNAQDQENLFMKAVYMKNGFKSANISGHAIRLMSAAIEKLINLDVDLIIGGCTEVSVGIEPALVEHPYIDVVDLLAKKTVDHCYNPELITI